jgi:predicted nucleic acid-binding protein
MDLLIAVTALKAGAILVTNNVNHFNNIGIPLENWMK